MRPPAGPPERRRGQGRRRELLRLREGSGGEEGQPGSRGRPRRGFRPSRCGPRGALRGACARAHHRPARRGSRGRGRRRELRRPREDGGGGAGGPRGPLRRRRAQLQEGGVLRGFEVRGRALRRGPRVCVPGRGGTVRRPGSPAAGGGPGGGRVPDPRARGRCGLGALVPGSGDRSETPSVPATAGWGALPAPDDPPRGQRRARGAGPRVPAGAAPGGGRAAGADGGGRVGLGASPGQVPRRCRPAEEKGAPGRLGESGPGVRE